MGGTLHPAPGSPAVENAVVLVADSRITAVGALGAVTVPDSLPVFDARGSTILAGFWNSHVHFTEPLWASAATMPDSALQAALGRMLLRFGFVRVFDTGSFPAVTFAIRRRIATPPPPASPCEISSARVSTPSSS